MKATKITAVDFFDDLTSSYARKRFFSGFVIIIVLCLLILSFVEYLMPWPTIKEIVASILIEVVAGSVIVLGFYVIYVYFIGANTAPKDVNVIRPQDISERMTEMHQDVHYYMFWGRSGSYFRAKPLLELDKQATDHKRKTEVFVLLPDPEEPDLVEAYRDILKALGEEQQSNQLLSNVLATCMACAILASNNKYLDITISLSRFLPAFRVDLSDKGAIITQDDKKKSALHFKYGSEFYHMFYNTVTNERDVSRKIEWNKSIFRDLKLDEKSCTERTLNNFGLIVQDLKTVQQEVSHLITQRPHRYQ